MPRILFTGGGTAGHVTPNLALTPDIQLITDPALDPAEDELWVFSLRSRVTF